MGDIVANFQSILNALPASVKAAFPGSQVIIDAIIQGITETDFLVIQKGKVGATSVVISAQFTE